MSLFHVQWHEREERCPFVIDASDAAHAKRIAKEIAGGKAPVIAREIPVGVFAAECVWEGAGDDEDEFSLEPVEHFVDLCEAYEDADLVAGEPSDTPAIDYATMTQRAPPGAGPCRSEGEDDEGNVLRCSLWEGHQSQHQTADGAFAWGDA